MNRVKKLDRMCKEILLDTPLVDVATSEIAAYIRQHNKRMLRMRKMTTVPVSMCMNHIAYLEASVKQLRTIHDI